MKRTMVFDAIRHLVSALGCCVLAACTSHQPPPHFVLPSAVGSHVHGSLPVPTSGLIFWAGEILSHSPPTFRSQASGSYPSYTVFIPECGTLTMGVERLGIRKKGTYTYEWELIDGSERNALSLHVWPGGTMAQLAAKAMAGHGPAVQRLEITEFINGIPSGAKIDVRIAVERLDEGAIELDAKLRPLNGGFATLVPGEQYTLTAHTYRIDAGVKWGWPLLSSSPAIVWRTSAPHEISLTPLGREVRVSIDRELPGTAIGTEPQIWFEVCGRPFGAIITLPGESNAKFVFGAP